MDGGTRLPSASGTRRGGGRARTWFLIHSWLGFKLSLVLGVICLSGSLASVSHEIDWLLTPTLRSSAPPSAPMAWEAAGDALAAAYPGARIGTVRAPEGPGFAATAIVTLPDGRQRIAHLDPSTGCVQGDASRQTVQRFLRDLHMWLFITNSWGLVIVSAFSVPLLASLVTGLVVYKRFWRGFFRLRLRAGSRVLVGDLHRLIGLWSLWFVAAIGVTSFWYLIEVIGYMNGHRFDRPVPAVPAQSLADLGAAPRPLGLGEVTRLARAAYPGLQVVAVVTARSVREPVVVWGQDAAWLVRERANAVRLHPVTGAVLDIQRGEALTPMQRVVETADPLHFGNFGGLPVKLFYFVFGLGLTGLIVSGGWLALRRGTRLWRAAGLSKTDSWRLGRWRWANIALLGTATALAPAALSAWEDGGTPRDVGTRDLGPYQVTLLWQENGPAAQRGLHLRLDCGGCLANLRSAWLRTEGQPDLPIRLASSLGSSPVAQHGPDRELSIEIEAWDGMRTTARWVTD
ncbi:PepSY domain-containing protein [Belnapia sp. T18]|uniref:PepSY domain-containing protein n=1 Tax=Belnapia arida TaxID=2804533 RepID=A0ABS1UD88_9PROT|nr:PepSY-associated TM helix domain-containing protein [Belnapia arida]MBL6082655.1 PepSY domain-containing protein [Belnapia arida]